MKKETKILIGIVTVLLILVGISFLINPNNNKKETAAIPTPEMIVIPTREPLNYQSQSGAVYISPTDQEYTEIELIKILRNKTPVETTAFTINYDYDKNVFVVNIKDKSDQNLQLYNQWMKQAGYDRISPQYIAIQ